MSFTDNNMFMPVAPAYGNNGGAFGMGGEGGWWFLVILFALFGWGGNNNFGNNAAPYVINSNTDSEIRSGFDQQAVMSGINGIKESICSSVPVLQQSVNEGFANAEIAANGRQMANMQQNFLLQQQVSNGAFANQLATEKLTATVLAENCSDRQAISDGIRDVINVSNTNTQRLIDIMYQNKMDAKDETIAALRQQALMEQIEKINSGQTSTIQAGQRNLANEIEQYVSPKAVPAYIVQNPNGCGNCQFNACGY